MRIKNIFASVLAAVVLVIAGYVTVLCLSDASGDVGFRITSETGDILCPFAVMTFALSVVYICYRYGDTPCDAARGGILLAALPHAVLILSLLILTLAVTNFFNHSMEFLTSGLSKSVIIVYAVLSLGEAVCVLECSFSGRNR